MLILSNQIAIGRILILEKNENRRELNVFKLAWWKKTEKVPASSVFWIWSIYRLDIESFPTVGKNDSVRNS